MFLIIWLHLNCCCYFSLRYFSRYMHVHLYARTTHTHHLTQVLTYVISFQFNHHPPVHTNSTNCIALFALSFNISKPTKTNWLYQPSTSLADFLVVSLTVYPAPGSPNRSTVRVNQYVEPGVSQIRFTIGKLIGVEIEIRELSWLNGFSTRTQIDFDKNANWFRQ